jgi:hypothetical protein
LWSTKPVPLMLSPGEGLEMDGRVLDGRVSLLRGIDESVQYREGTLILSFTQVPHDVA